ncbi:hypothetical protein AAC387_Pa10g0419 [Persea americana]
MGDCGRQVVGREEARRLMCEASQHPAAIFRMEISGCFVVLSSLCFRDHSGQWVSFTVAVGDFPPWPARPQRLEK